MAPRIGIRIMEIVKTESAVQETAKIARHAANKFRTASSDAILRKIAATGIVMKKINMVLPADDGSGATSDERGSPSDVRPATNRPLAATALASASSKVQETPR